jgi:hypothetical protein
MFEGQSKREAKRLITEARRCFVQARFGTSERYVRISKTDARDLVRFGAHGDMYVRIDDDGDCYLS